MKLFNYPKVVPYPKAFLGAILGFVFFAVAFYPGFMSSDSLQQYEQSHTLQFRDALPPVMAWLWSKLNIIWHGPQSLLLLHLGVLWTGLYIWRRNAGDSKWAIGFILLGAMPWIANFEGVLWKDMGMAFSLLLALALLSGEKQTKAKLVTVGFLLLYAFMVRDNAVIAIIPIIWYASAKIFPRLSGRIRVVITFIWIVLMFVFLQLFNYELLNAEKSHMTGYMMVDDLSNLSVTTGENLFPRNYANTIKECSQEVIMATNLVGRGFCINAKQSYKEIPYEEFKEAWIYAVKNYPLEYVTFRLSAYLYLLRSPSVEPYYHWQNGIQTNEMGVVQQDNVATMILKKYVKGSANLAPFLFKPYWWLIVAFLFAGTTFFMRGNKESLVLIRVLLASAILYLLGYIPVTTAADFRFAYWSILAISLAMITYLTSNLSLKFGLDSPRS